MRGRREGDAGRRSGSPRPGRIDILVTSAGIQRYGTVTATTEQTWDEVFAVNVEGAFLAARADLRADGGLLAAVAVALPDTQHGD